MVIAVRRHHRQFGQSRRRQRLGRFRRYLGEGRPVLDAVDPPPFASQHGKCRVRFVVSKVASAGELARPVGETVAEELMDGGSRRGGHRGGQGL